MTGETDGPFAAARPERSEEETSAPASASRDMRRAMLAGTAALALTSIHHVYGALRYETPDRYHAVVIAGVTFAAMLGAYALGRGRSARPVARVGWWAFWGLTAGIPVVLFGLVEGFYNHLVKVTLYFGGVSDEGFRRLFPGSIFETPNDVFFEATGVLQVVPGAVAAYHLLRMLRERPALSSA